MNAPQRPEYVEPGIASFQRTDRLARFRRWSLWLAVLAVLGWLTANFLGRGRTERRYSPGPVAAVHTMWNERCEVCHSTSRPLGADNWLARLVTGTHAGDVDCTTCHQGPPHHRSQKAEEVAACTACHTEHHGVDASLLRVANSQCTRCHADLNTHANWQARGYDAGEAPARPGDVAAFALGSHPPFALCDTRRLKFSHRRHMMIGLVEQPNQSPFRYLDIPDSQRARYLPYGTNPSQPVRLRCETCHQLDTAGASSPNPAAQRLPEHTLHSARAGGELMLPITYETRCAACHPLTVGHEKYAVLRVPHRLPPEDLGKYLQGLYGVEYLEKQLASDTEPNARPLPGRPRQAKEQLASLREAIREPIARAERELYESRIGCALCHYLGAAPADPAPTGLTKLRQIEPTRIPAVWLRRASFNHSRHRHWDCRYCHANADAYLSTARNAALNPHSGNSGNVLVPGIKNCLECHAAGQQAVARSDCVECHHYHNGDHPLAGKGAVLRQPEQTVQPAPLQMETQ
jgi:predicted CXXCH cytochrome family protein